MYVRDLYIRNMKLLRDFKVSFSRGDQARPWTVFVGENGYCKTTILRAIGLAASGRDRANQLAQNITPSLPDKRAGAGECEFGATFSFPGVGVDGRPRTYPGIDWPLTTPPSVRSDFVVHPTVLAGTSTYVGGAYGAATSADPLADARASELASWFVAAYGVGRALPDPQTLAGRSYIASLDRMRSLFDGSPLIATDFASRFEATLTRGFAKQLREAFVDHHLLPDVSDIELRGQGGAADARKLVESHRFAFSFADGSEPRLPAVWLSHGYQSTIAWIADFVGQVSTEAETVVPLEHIEGLVLIDELDLHLHPRWQRGLVKLLKETFPRVQFVATTHSPMVLPGLEADEIFVLRQDDAGSVTATQATQDPDLLTGGQLYRTFFDIESLYPAEAGRLQHEYALLASNAFRSDADERRLAEVRDRLDALNSPPWFPSRPTETPMIRLHREPNEPPSLTAARTAELARIRRDHPAGPPTRQALKDRYTVVAEQLWQQQQFKCCYCEHKVRLQGHDVEHYRPVSRYWWLAWTWSNLLFACPNCNRWGKNDEFPLQDERDRLVAEQAPPGRELPLLIDPSAADPMRDIHYVFTVAKQWEAKPRGGSVRGGVTITVVKLNAQDLVELRGDHVDAQVRPESAKILAAITRGDGAEVRVRWRELTERLLQPSMPFRALSHDALDALVPEADRAAWGLALSPPA